MCLHGGVSTGFHHIASSPPPDLHRLYQIIATSHPTPTGTRTHIAVRQVLPEASSLKKGDVFVLDLGTKVLQFNTKLSSGKEKFAAAEFVRNLVDNRKGHCELSVFDESGQGAGVFLSSLGVDSLPPRDSTREPAAKQAALLFRLSDASAALNLTPVSPASIASLASPDAFLVDTVAGFSSPSIFVWIGREAALNEKRLAMQYGQQYLYEKREKGENVSPAVSIVKVNEGAESEGFLHALGK